jgi:hypothetical protein
MKYMAIVALAVMTPVALLPALLPAKRSTSLPLAWPPLSGEHIPSAWMAIS